MTTPAPVVVRPGQRATADLVNSGLLIGRLVFFATRDTTQAITSGGTSGDPANSLIWETITLDVLGGWSSAQPSRYTPQRAGWYQLTGATGFAGSAAGTFRGVSWIVNGGLATAATAKPVAAATAATSVTAEARALPVQLNGTTDYVQLAPFQNTGSNLDTAGGSPKPFIAVYYTGPS